MARNPKTSAHFDESVEGEAPAEPSEKNTATFSLRLPPRDYEILSSIAKLRNVSIAELARQFIVDGIRAALDPNEITRMIEAEKRRLLQAAEDMRAGV